MNPARDILLHAPHAIVAIGALVVVLQRRIDAFLGTDWPMSDAA